MDKIITAGMALGHSMGLMFTSRIFWTTFTGWFIAALAKMMIYWWRNGKMDFHIFVGTGGMPSSHSAFVACLATVIGMVAGWDSPVFMLALGFAIVTMNDAQGVRRASGHQASILNRIADDMYQKKQFRPERVKELLGHTPIQVYVGCAIGVVVGLVSYL